MELLVAEETTPAVIATFVVVVFTVAALLFFRRDRDTLIVSTAVPILEQENNKKQRGDQETASVLNQMSQTERLQLQSRVANAKTCDDLYCIFDDFDILHNLDLRGVGGEDATPDQAFRDLVRDKITLNDQTVFVSAEHTSSPSAFRQYFHRLILDIVKEQHITSREISEKQAQRQEIGNGIRKSKNCHLGKGGKSEGSKQQQEQQQALATHLCW